jgi:hypothetical protein
MNVTTLLDSPVFVAGVVIFVVIDIIAFAIIIYRIRKNRKS